MSTIRRGIVLAALAWQIDPQLHAADGSDEAALLEVPPREVVDPRPDEREDLVLPAVLADEGRGQPEAPPRLDLRGEAEDRRREEVDLVVDDQPPVVLGEEIEMGEVIGLRSAVRHDLVGGDGDRRDRLLLARVLADRLGRELRLGEDLLLPLADGGDVRGEDQGLGVEAGFSSKN